MAGIAHPGLKAEAFEAVESIEMGGAAGIAYPGLKAEASEAVESIEMGGAR
jgi:hypothetical protein